MRKLQTEKIAERVRRHTIDMGHRSKTAEIGSALCIADIITVLYFEIMNIFPKKPNHSKRDRFVLSKGHGAASLYAVLAECGFFPMKTLEKYRVDGGILHGHPSKGAVPGIEVSTGSLGHGLSIAAGMALSLKHQNSQSKVYVLLGDGECNEGSVWEAASFIAMHRLDNIITIVDDNGFQGFGKTKEVLNMDIAKIFKAFGWNVYKTDGHDHASLVKTLKKVRKTHKPSVIMAKTVAGKGIASIENTLLAHYYVPKEND